MSRISSYVPESLFLDQKDEAHMRVCREDFVLVDPANGYRVVAGRGKGICEGEIFEPLRKMPKAEREFMERALARHRRIFLQGRDGPILVFGELLAASGLLLVLCPRFDVLSVRRGLLLLRKNEFACSEKLEEHAPTPRRGDVSVCDCLQEIFYYLDRILLPSKDTALWTSAALIANFAGCRADFGAMPAESVALLPHDRLRLSAFLLCLFLSMRNQSIAASVRGELSESAVSISALPIVPQGESFARSDFFLRLPAFRDISLRMGEGGFAVQARFCRSTETLALHSLVPAAVEWCAFFRCAV